MVNSATQQVAEYILKLLPEDGTPVLNRVMRAMIGRAMAKAVPSDTYVSACDDLVRRGSIGRSRGQGGRVYLVGRKPQDQAAPLAPTSWTEARLMGPLKSYLQGPFREGLELPSNSVCIVRDTSKMGPVKGRWARPDFMLITAMRFKVLPNAQLDVHSFELKSETGATDLAVYEALAQTRFTHFGHLVWHLPEGSPAEARLNDIERQCEQHGIGLILLRNPAKPDASEIVLDPVRKGTLAADVDSFLESRLDENDRTQLRSILTGGGV